MNLFMDGMYALYAPKAGGSGGSAKSAKSSASGTGGSQKSASGGRARDRRRRNRALASCGKSKGYAVESGPCCGKSKGYSDGDCCGTSGTAKSGTAKSASTACSEDPPPGSFNVGNLVIVSTMVHSHQRNRSVSNLNVIFPHVPVSHPHEYASGDFLLRSPAPNAYVGLCCRIQHPMRRYAKIYPCLLPYRSAERCP